MSIKRNTLYNVGGALSPLVLTLVTVPLYLQAIGEARYGLLALVWLLLGYFGLFDLGLSTATANALARARVAEPDARGRIFMTSLLTNAGLGVGIAAAVLLIAPPVLTRMGNLSSPLRAEILAVLPWLAASIPLVTVGGVLNGVLTAHERFGTINLVNILGTVLFQLVPLWAAYTIGTDLQTIIPAAVIARAVPVAMIGAAALRQLPLRGARFDRAILGTLLGYGGWVMVTNLVSPLLVSADQFVIATLLGAGAVAQYAIAYSLAVRLQIIPNALIQTLFPKLSQQNGEDALVLAGQAFRSVLVVMTVICVPAILLIRPFLAFWINEDFARTSGPVAEILLISMWVNGLAFPSAALLQAQGRPDLVAKFHLLEIVPFFVALYALIYYFGLSGAAVAWALRIILDTSLLTFASKIHVKYMRFLPVALSAIIVGWSIARLELLGWPYSLLIATGAGCGLLAVGFFADPLLQGMARTFEKKLRRGR